MYQYNDIPRMQESAEVIHEMLKSKECRQEYGDFYRTGMEIYVGSFPDVSGPDLVIDPHDEKGIDIFREFCEKISAHYKTLEHGKHKF